MKYTSENTKRELQLGEYKSKKLNRTKQNETENKHRGKQIGNTGRKIEIGKYTSDNTNRAIQIVT